MEYRFSLTPRLIALTIFCSVALLVLLFTLGFQIGQRMARPEPALDGAGAEAWRAGVAVEQRVAGQLANDAAAAAAPITDRAHAVQRALP